MLHITRVTTDRLSHEPHNPPNSLLLTHIQPHASPLLTRLTYWFTHTRVSYWWHVPPTNWYEYTSKSDTQTTTLWKCCMDCLLFQLPIYLFSTTPPPPSPLPFFVFCLWSDFIPYATELFGPVGRWSSSHHPAHHRHRSLPPYANDLHLLALNCTNIAILPASRPFLLVWLPANPTQLKASDLNATALPCLSLCVAMGNSAAVVENHQLFFLCCVSKYLLTILQFSLSLSPSVLFCSLSFSLCEEEAEREKALSLCLPFALGLSVYLRHYRR